MSDPFLITSTAVISFSGGRTSGYMLWRILQAHGGTLPADVVVCFANTGREMPATLDFVARCASEWGVHVVWLEFTRRAKDGFEVVSHNSASRRGEPFEALIHGKHMLPNPVMRSCTQELKIRTIERWVRAEMGWIVWANVIGLRADDPPGRLENMRPGSVAPLVVAGITKPAVLAFWAEQPFDLGLAGPWEGNCDGCYLKSRASIMRMQRDHPGRMKWWPAMEALEIGTSPRGRTFNDPHDREPYAALADLVRRTPMLPMDETMHELAEACDGGCGT